MCCCLGLQGALESEPGLCGTGPGAAGVDEGVGAGGGGGGSGGATDAVGTLAGGGCSGCLGLEKGGGAFAGADPGLMPAGIGITGTAPGFGGGAPEGGFAIPGLTTGCGRRALGFAGDPVGARAGSGGICWPGAAFAGDPALFAGGRAGSGGCCWPGADFAVVPSEKGWDMPVLGGPIFNGSGRLMGGVMLSHLPFTFTQ